MRRNWWLGTYFTLEIKGKNNKNRWKLRKNIIQEEEKFSHNSMDISDREDDFLVETSMEMN